MAFLNKRIPTILGLLILIIGLGAGIYLVDQKQLFGSKADPELIPRKIKITNVADNQFTVSWITNKATIGFIRYGTSASVESLLADDRDQRSGQNQAFKTHYVTASGLKPVTKYYFKIGSGSEKNLFDNDNNGKPYEITTGPTLGAQPSSDLINGKIITETGAPAEGAIVYVSLPNAAPLSTQVKADGAWLVILSAIKTSDLSDYISYDSKAALIDIFVQADSKTAKATIKTVNDSPVPEISLGQTYDFTDRADVLLTQDETASPESTYQLETDVGQFPIEPLTNLPVEVSPAGQVSLLNPQTEGEAIYSLKPEISGTGPSKKVLTVTIESSKTYTTTVVVDNEGNWRFTPPEALEPGRHTVTITYIDDEGEEQSLERNFVIATSNDDSIPAFTATPSAASSPSASPGTRTSVPSTESGVPEPGNANPTIIILMLGLILIGLGFVLKLRLLGALNK